MSTAITELRRLSSEQYELRFSDGSTIKTAFTVVADYSLYTGRELTEEELSEVLEASALAGCKDRAMRIISARPMSERELYDRLVEKGESEQNAAASVAYLIGLHFLDDTEYAAMVVRHYAAKGYGARRVRDELYRRKIPRELWDEALEQMPEQEEEIDRLLRARLRGTEAPDRVTLKKATDALLRRGFSWDEVRAAVNRYQAEAGFQ